MPRSIRTLVLVGAIAASIFGYFSYMPNTEGIAQMNRVRSIASILRVSYIIGRTTELLGISDRIQVFRYFSNTMGLLKEEKEDAGLLIKDTKIKNIPVRIARPANNENNLPAIVYFHGGAFYMGSVDTHNGFTSALARSANAVVISVDYRLAPEYPFPAGLEDCYTVTKYVLQHGDSEELGIDRERVAIGGDSAGGNFAAVISMRLATNPVGRHSPRLQILIYPLLQTFDFMLPSYITESFQILPYTVDHVLSAYFHEKIDSSIYANNHLTVAMKQRFRKYVDWSFIPEKYRTVYQKPITDDKEGDPELIERSKLTLHREVSPLLVENEQLAKLPRTYILSVGRDSLRDEAFIYGGRLKQSGVSVVHKHYEDGFHAAIMFLHGPFGLDLAHEMVKDLANYLNDNL